MPKFDFIKLLKDIKFWLFLFLLIRLFGITNPPLEVAHSWRQVTTNMYARNFLQISPNIFYARVDMAGEKTGITAKEFPVFNYSIFLTAKVFGYQHWYGRLINLLISTLGIFFFYRLIKDFVHHETAFWAALVLLFSIWFAYSRKIMPDTFSMSFILAGLFYGLHYLKSQKPGHLLLYFILVALGMLSKIPSAYVLSVFLLPFLNKNILTKNKVIFAIVSFIILFINYLWYFQWVPYIVETYGFEHYPQRTFAEGWAELQGHWGEVAHRFYFSAFYSFMALGLMLAGIALAFLKKEYLLLYILLLTLLPFAVFIVKAGFTFYHHNYYIIPFVPVMALFAGFSLQAIPNKKLSVAAIGIVAIEGIANQQHEFFVKEKDWYRTEFEAVADSIVPQNALIVIDGGRNPADLYFTNRKGWTYYPERFNRALLDSLKDKGCEFYFQNKNYYTNDQEIPTYNLPVVYEGTHLNIYQLHQKEKQ